MHEDGPCLSNCQGMQTDEEADAIPRLLEWQNPGLSLRGARKKAPGESSPRTLLGDVNQHHRPGNHLSSSLQLTAWIPVPQGLEHGGWHKGTRSTATDIDPTP